MIGQVISIDYQLCVKFEDGVVAILPDMYDNNCDGVWRDFSYREEYVIEGYTVYNSKTPPFKSKELVEDYNRVAKRYEVYIRNRFGDKYEMTWQEITKIRNKFGYVEDRNVNILMRDRILKIKKLRTKIKTI